MRLVKSLNALRQNIKNAKAKGKTIGFVPTMGYLHQGHISLVRKAVKDSDFVAVSIFVNPTQFGPREDLSRYPKDLKKDLRMLRKAGADIVFAPSAQAMYPEGFQSYVEVKNLGDVLCGRSRPGHFKGVSTVVTKLFNLVDPDIAYFGQKDAQQSIIIKKMAEDLNTNVKIKVEPTVREKDGLAMSSRNAYLKKEEREEAAILYKSLLEAKRLINNGVKSSERIINAVRRMIKSVKTAKIDYVSIIDAKDLKPVKTIKGRVLIALAVWFGKTRLIDNIILEV